MQKFSKQFWLINSIQAIERLAYWIVLLQMPIYIAQKDLEGGLQWPQSIKGLIFFWWALIQNFSPIITGGFADKFGRKKVMFIACILMIFGFGLLAHCRTFYPFLCSTLLLGLGMGVFKPALQGVVSAQFISPENTTKTSQNQTALGWGIYVTFVNIGYFLGPLFSSTLKEINWQWVFFGSAVLTTINASLLILIKEDNSTKRSNVSVKQIMTESARIISNTFKNIVRPNVIIFIVLITGFTLNHMQFYETLPNFVSDWTDTSMIANYLPNKMLSHTERGTMLAFEWIFNINSTMLVLFVAFSSWFTRSCKLIKMCSVGLTLAAGGLFIAGFTMNGLLLVLGVFVLAIGEILVTPRISEYFGSIATPATRSQYLGYANLAWLFGLSGGGIVGGYLYQHLGEKATFACKYLTTHFGLQNVNPSDAMNILSTKTGLNAADLTALLWNTYSPWHFWLPFLIVGLLCAVGLYWYSISQSKKRGADFRAD